MRTLARRQAGGHCWLADSPLSTHSAPTPTPQNTTPATRSGSRSPWKTCSNFTARESSPYARTHARRHSSRETEREREELRAGYYCHCAERPQKTALKSSKTASIHNNTGCSRTRKVTSRSAKTLRFLIV